MNTDLIKIRIENKILFIRDNYVMLDSDLAELYQTETKFINRAMKRNPDRFPESFVFQLTENEWEYLRCQNGTLEKGRGQHRKYLPHVFTEQGVAMLSAVLQTTIAISVSVQIINAFVEMRKLLMSNAGLLQRVSNIENKMNVHNIQFEKVFHALNSQKIEPKQDIFFNGQIYDAYSFVTKLIEKAKKELVLIDNYIDTSVLDMLTKKISGVEVIIITNQNTKINKSDIDKFNAQHPLLKVNRSNDFHDRFLLIDGCELYHIGASVKDLGKKCFAFSKMESEVLINKIKSMI